MTTKVKEKEHKIAGRQFALENGINAFACDLVAESFGLLPDEITSNYIITVVCQDKKRRTIHVSINLIETEEKEKVDGE